MTTINFKNATISIENDNVVLTSEGPLAIDSDEVHAFANMVMLLKSMIDQEVANRMMAQRG